MTILRFQYAPPLPCEYSAATSTITACLDCLTARENRFCDGTTTPTWTLCTSHQQANDWGDIQYDEGMLQFLRESVYDGSIPKPRPETSHSLRRSTRAIDCSAGQKYDHMPLDQSDYNRELERDNNSRKIEQALNSSSSGISTPGHSNLQPRVLRKDAVHILWPVPTIDYLHTSTCFHHPGPRFFTEATTTSQHFSTDLPGIKLLTSTEAFLQQDARHTELMARLRGRSSQQREMGGCDGELDQQIRDMKEELTTSRIAKGIFFRRCNGMYVNALGWVWEDDKPDLNTVNEVKRNEVPDTPNDATSATNKEPVDSVVSNTQSADKRDKASFEHIGNSCKVNEANEHSMLDQSDHHESGDQRKYLPSPTSNRVRRRRSLHILNRCPRPIEQPLYQEVDILESQNFSSQSTSPMASPRHRSTSTSSPAASNVSTNTNIEVGHSHRNTHICIDADQLRVRELLVQAGTVSPEDLAITCWALNQQATKQAQTQNDAAN